MRVLKSKRFRKRGVYRLEGASPEGAPVIAKICKREVAEVETVIYEELLPRLPMPSLRYYGHVQDGDRQHSWLFLEDAGAERYSPGDPEHRRLAARWLAAVALQADEVFGALDVPDRGPRHYFVHLLRAREQVERQLRRKQDRVDAVLVMENLRSKLDVLESRWSEWAAFCEVLPRTLVHGDLVPKNLRIKRDGMRVGLAMFDWETAGVGPQAPDLAQLLEPERSEIALVRRSERFDRFSANPCLDTYRSLLVTSGVELEKETVDMSAAVGNLFRCVAGLDWTCSQATASWSPIDDFWVYSEWLGSAMELAGVERVT
jgi:hypothetical protein